MSNLLSYCSHEEGLTRLYSRLQALQERGRETVQKVALDRGETVGSVAEGRVSGEC